ncbi:hypothetical protein NP233_g2737 [Leucocoprinus birnbaumii]|uniref:Arrestin-like N-terminal domain-containing protein n=1 Tax=Leucocoprinus birnbaumii TaxID=56174 RepID=A0AAD5W1M9_9AGAR|nr:hypothetical protein NP233_g2737 [Leucocoprinus birnbaumii]
MADPELPGYNDIVNVPATGSIPSNARVESYSPYKSEFKTGLPDDSGYYWLVLRVKSRSPSAKNVPFFLEGDTISGLVELDATKTSSVKEVSVELQAGTTAVGQEEERFLSLKETLWPAISETGSKSSTKLQGMNEWPFRFTLPREVEVHGPQNKKGFYQLPPSFSERASPAYLDYRISVRIKRGSFKVSQKLTTAFGYQPITVPGSPMRPALQLANAEGNPLPNPKQEPEGWKSQQKLKIEGTLFGAKKLSVARPLEYAIGSPLPLYLVIESEDEQAMEVLSSPTAIRVELTRAMTTGSEATAEKAERRSNNFFVVALSRAFFWVVDEPGCGPNRRVLHGEIDLEAKLKPTFVFPRLSIEYAVDFIGFETTGWVAEGQTSKAGPTLSEPVMIVSRQLSGVITRSNAPPEYKKPEVDYNKSLGYLENGNQRFLHHSGFM